MLVHKTPNQPTTKIRISPNLVFGDTSPAIIAGPCSIESFDQLLSIATAVKKLGAHMLRGGAFKPRTSPYAFQGLGEEGLKIMKKVGEMVDLPIISEIISTDNLPLYSSYLDMIQIGSRNMHNFDLLKKVAHLNKPILLKRGMAATLEEFLMAAEYILKEGNSQVVLCERGIRTFETSSRNTLDLNTLALLKLKTHLPVIVDPSHAAGNREIVAPLARAGLACGADGLIIEVHNQPEKALSDGPQSLTFKQFDSLISQI